MILIRSLCYLALAAFTSVVLTIASERVVALLCLAGALALLKAETATSNRSFRTGAVLLIVLVGLVLFRADISVGEPSDIVYERNRGLTLSEEIKQEVGDQVSELERTDKEEWRDRMRALTEKADNRTKRLRH